MLVFHDYVKAYGDHLVLKVPDLQLQQGIYWLKGGNGSGKTTLIKSVAGLIPFKGTITAAGNDIGRHRIAYRRIVNYAEAEPVYPVFLTGDDLIRFYIDTKGGNKQQAAKLAASLGVDAYSANKIGTYSSGMAKKLSLVLAFIGAPRLVLLDEPLITLDQQSVETLQDIVGSLYAAGVSFLVTSHQEIHFAGRQPERLAIVNKELTLVTPAGV